MHEEDTRILLLNNSESETKIYYLDLETGKVVDEYVVDFYIKNNF